MYFGPGQGGGSIPEMVMRTGAFMPFNANDVRSDIQVPRIQDVTQLPTGQLPMPVPQQASVNGFGYAFGADAAPSNTVALAVLVGLSLVAGIGVWRSL